MGVASLFSRSAWLLAGLLMQLCLADRLILQSVLDCKSVHPQCQSCVVRRSSANGLVSDAELLCRACTSSAYRLFEDETTTTCGESQVEQLLALSAHSSAGWGSVFNSSSCNCNSLWCTRLCKAAQLGSEHCLGLKFLALPLFLNHNLWLYCLAPCSLLSWVLCKA
jgi:hypothetical protein